MKTTTVAQSELSIRLAMAADKARGLLGKQKHDRLSAYGLPRGGALALYYGDPGSILFNRVLDPLHADVCIDDVAESGLTGAKWLMSHPCIPYFPLWNKREPEDADVGWLVFPWEVAPGESPENAKGRDACDDVTRILEHIGENPRREGLVDTPARVVKSWKALYAGYSMDVKEHFRVFEDGRCDEMVVLRNIEFYSTCEHHMLPFSGKAHIGYVPRDRVIGVSKLARILEVFARRLQIQERIGQQVTDALVEGLNPLGAACVLEAQHLCMTARGVQKQNSVMVTASLRGCFKTEDSCRNEFYRHIGK